MKRASVLLVAVGVLAGCGRAPDQALRVTVTLKAVGERRVQADCLRLAVLDSATELKSTVVPRPTDDVAVFAVLRGADLPASVRLQVSGFFGTCGDAATYKLNAQGDPVAQEFPEQGVKAVELSLEPPGPALDGDRDGFVAVDKGGVDCRDTGTGAATVFPGAGQLCDVYDDTDCDGAAGCDDSQCAAAPACADQADRLVIISTPVIAELRRYECVGPFRVELRNAQGPRSAVRDVSVALTSSLPGTSLHAQAGCGDTPVTSYPLRYGDTGFDVYLAADGQAYGLTSLRASAPGVAMPGSASVQVRPQPIAQLRFGAALAPVVAGTCSTEQVTLELIDAQGRPTAVESPSSLSLSANPTVTGGLFFSDAACATPAPTAALTPGQGVVRLHVSSPRAGSITMSAASSTGQGPVTQVLDVVPAAATHLAFANQSLAVQSTQGCSAGQLEIELRDAFENTVTPTSDVPVQLTSTISDLTFRAGADTGCTGTPLTQVTLPAMATRVFVRVKPGLAGSGTVTAAAPTVVGIAEATQALDVAGGPPARVVLVGQAQTARAGDCTASPIELALRDAAGNPSSFTSTVTANLTVTPAAQGTFGFFSAPGCSGTGAMTVQIPSGQSRVQLYFRGTRAVTAFAIGAGISSPGGITAATPLQNNAILPNVPGKLVYVSTTSHTVSADNCSGTYNLNVLDTFDNPTSFTTAQDVTVAPAGVTLGTGVACFGSSVSLPANTTSAAFTANSRVTGTYQVTATVGGLSTVTPAQLTVTPGASTLAVSAPAGGAATLQAGGCQAVTLLRRDAWGNNAPTSGTIALGLPAGTFAYSGACPAGASTGGGTSSLTLTNSHTIGFNLKPTVVGSPSVTATLGAQVATVNLTVTPGAPVLQFEAPTGGATTITAGTCATVTVARKDPFNNDVPLGADGAITFGALPAGLSLHAAGDCGGATLTSVPVAASAARATFLVRSTQSGAGQTLQLSLGGDNLTLTLGVNPASPIFRFVTPASGAATAVADGCVAVQVERRDSFNNPVPLGATSSLAFTVTGTASAYAATNCSGTAVTSISMAAGSFQQSFGVKSTVAGSHTLRSTLASQTLDLALTVTPGAPVLQFEAPTGGTATITAGTCATVTVARKDTFGNDVPLGADGAVTFGTLPSGMTVNAQGDCGGAAITSVPVLGSAARATFLVRSTQSGAGQTLQVTLGTQSVTLTLGVNPASPTFRFVTPASGAATALANGCVTVQVERRDSFNNPVPLGATSSLTFSVTAGTATVHVATDCSSAAVTSISMAAGSFQQSFGVKSTVAGAHTVRATLTAQTLDLSLTVTPAAFAKLVVLGLPATLTAGTCTASAVTVRRTDAFDNPITADGPITVTLASTPLSFSSQVDCSGAAAGATVTIPLGASTSSDAIYATGTLAGGASVTATSGSVTGTGSTTITAAAAAKVFFLNPPSPLTVQAGACSGVMTLQLRDQYDNPVTPSANTDVTLTASPSTGVTFTRGNSTCAANDTTVRLSSGSPTQPFLMKATVAPATVVVTAAFGSLTSATLSWSVTVGPPTVLAWKTAPPTTVDRFTCTAAGVVETRDSSGNVSPATGAVTITPSSSATAAGLVFYTDATCTTVASSFSIAQGASEVPLYVAAGGSGATNLNATATGFTAAGTRSTTVANNPATLAVTPASLTLEAGACVAVTVERQVSAAPTTLGSSTLQLSVPGGTTAVSLHTDAACTSANALSVSAVAGPGESSKVFYVRGRTGGDNAATTLNATAAETSGAASNVTVPLSALPLVRRGTCTVADVATECRATLAPAIPGHDITRSFLVFTSTGSPTQAGEIRPMDANLECHLEAGATQVEVVCTRTGNRQPMTVAWQVVSHGRSFANGGVSVQHLPVADTNDATDTDVTISTVDPTTSFVLLSSSGGTGSETTNDGSHFLTATLTSATNVRLAKAEAGVRRYSAQVVSAAGTSVTRGELSVTTYTGTQGSLASVTRSRTTLLYTSRGLSGTAPEHMCKRRLRGSMAAGTSVDFSRGAGTAQAVCDDDPATVAWERVQWPACGTGVVNLCATVQHLATLALTGSNASGTTPNFTGVDRARSLAFTGGQGPGGQAAGEADFTGNANTGDDSGAFHGRVEFAASNSVTVTRSATGATSNFSLQVVEFTP